MAHGDAALGTTERDPAALFGRGVVNRYRVGTGRRDVDVSRTGNDDERRDSDG